MIRKSPFSKDVPVSKDPPKAVVVTPPPAAEPKPSRTVSKPAANPPRKPIPPDPPEQPKRPVDPPKPQTTRPDSAGPDIHLPATDLVTNTLHARIIYQRGRHFLENLTKRNGTYVRISESETIQLGTEFLAGEVQFRVVRPVGSGGGSALVDGGTIVRPGISLDGLNLNVISLEIFGNKGGWRPWLVIDSRGLKVGRGDKTEDFPALKTLARRHFRLTPCGSEQVTIQDLGSVNGIYRKIYQPEPLKDHTRFRLGAYLLEFRVAEPLPAVLPETRDGETQCCADLSPHAVLVVVRPDGKYGVKFPLTKTATILGQEQVD